MPQESDVDGRFRFTGLQQGYYQVLLPRQDGAHRPVHSHHVQLTETVHSQQVEFILSDLAPIRGRCVTADQSSPRHVSLRAQLVGGAPSPTLSVQRDGKFDLGWVPIDSEFDIEVMSNSTGSWCTLKPVRVKAGDEEVVIELVKSGSIRGQLFSPSGRSVDIGEVSFIDIDRGVAVPPRFLDAGGEFFSWPLIPGNYFVSVWTAQGEVAQFGPIALEPGQQLTLDPIPLDAGGELELHGAVGRDMRVQVARDGRVFHDLTVRAKQHLKLALPLGTCSIIQHVPEEHAGSTTTEIEIKSQQLNVVRLGER